MLTVAAKEHNYEICAKQGADPFIQAEVEIGE